MAFSVDNIKPYVDANENQLIASAVMKGKTASLLNLQTGVKGKSALNLLSAAPSLVDGSACGWDAAGTTTVSKREIETAIFKVNQAFCDKDLIGSSLQWGVKVAAGAKTLPFEEEFINQNLAEIQKQVEKVIWQGATSGATGTYLDLIDGFIAILGGESTVVDATVSGKTLSANILDAIDAIVAGLPDEIIDRDDLVIWLSYEHYRKYVKALQDANMFHYAPADLGGAMETIVPGTNIKVVAVAGLNGTDKAYASYASNMFLGTDMENDTEKFDFWYSQDNQEFRLNVQFNIGVQVAFPSMVVAYLA